MAMPRLIDLGRAVLCVAVVASCSSDAQKHAPPPVTSSGGSSGSGGSTNPLRGGNGGRSGTGGEPFADSGAGSDSAGSGAGTSDGGSAGESTSGHGGIFTEPVATGGEGGNDAGPLPTCFDAVAYESVNVSFVAPTPSEVALAFNALTFDSTHRAFVLAIESRNDSGSFLISKAELADDGIHQRFTATLPLVPGGLGLIDGQLHSTASQERGLLALASNLDVEVEELDLDASSANACGSLRGAILANIPDSAGDLLIPTSGSAKKLRELMAASDVRGGGATGPWRVKLLFDAQAIDFEFGAVAP